MNIYSISHKKLKRTHYDSADDLAAEIADYVIKTSRAVSLATDYRWWSRNIVDPYLGHVLNVSIGYEGDFLEDELISCLRKRGIIVSNFPGESWFYILRPSMC